MPLRFQSLGKLSLEQAEASKVLVKASRKGDMPTSSRPAWCWPVARFALLFVLVWIVLDYLYVSLPLIRPGAEVVSAAKFDSLTKSVMFRAGVRNRVLVFGTSRVLAGFQPARFDDALGSSTQSFNLGLPGDAHFLPILEAALAAGNVPTHVLLTAPWDDARYPPTLLDKIRNDGDTVAWLFPFRYLPRNAVLFALNSHMHVLWEYRRAAAERDKVLADRGWYFIKAESHYPGDQLPDNFALPTDRPDQQFARPLPATSWVKDRLMELARRYNFKVIFVPIPAREGAVKPTGDVNADRVKPISDSPDMRVVGPDAFTYPPRDYSDPVHLNTTGAELYTIDLARLMKRTGTMK